MEVQLTSICQKDGFATAKVMQYSKDCLSRLQDNLRACSHGAGSLESDSRDKTDKMLKALTKCRALQGLGLGMFFDARNPRRHRCLSHWIQAVKQRRAFDHKEMNKTYATRVEK